MFLGRIIVTPKASESIPSLEIEVALARHSRHDWGEIDSNERLRNERARGGRGDIVSRYSASNGRRFVVITPEKGAITGILLSDEYEGPSAVQWVC